VKLKSKLERLNAKDLKEKKVTFFYEPKEGEIVWYCPATIHTYTPDFWIQKKDGGYIVVETKGIWDYNDRFKHACIKRQYPFLDIRFVFSRSNTPTSKGARQTYRDICEGRGRGVFKGLTWKYADKRIPDEWLQE